MSDRDIPSVPVTTLAGLTSLSDLLSELPVSDSLSSVSSLNKSLLFHTLVADESHNLLSVRDDNLVKQLVHAIEQTNSDNIEVKSQYAITQHGTNISTYPELLQGIYTFRPTVFNTPQNHRTQNHQSPQQLQQQQLHAQQQYVSHQIQQPHTSSQILSHQRVGINIIQNPSETNNAATVLQQQPQQQQQQQQLNSPVLNNITVQQFMAVPPSDGKLQQQPQILQQVIINPTTTPAIATTNSPVQNNFVSAAYQQQSPQTTTIETTPVRRTRRSAAAAVNEHQQQQQQQHVSPPQVVSPKQQTSTSPQQNVVAYQKKQAAILFQHQQQQQQRQVQQQQPVSQQTPVIQPQTPVIQQQQSQQQHQPVIQQNHQQKTVILPTPQHQTVIIQQQQQQPVESVINTHSNAVQNVTSPQQKQYPQVLPQLATQKQQINTQQLVVTQQKAQQHILTPQQTLHTKQQHNQQNIQTQQQQQSTHQQIQQPQQKSVPQQQITTQVSQLPLQQLHLQQQQPPPQKQQHLQQKQQQNSQSLVAQQQILSQQQQQQQQVPNIIQGQFQNVLNLQRQHFAQQKQQAALPQKTTPRNSEYLQQQSKNFELRGPSPAQASTAPDSNQIQQKHSNTSAISSNNNNGNTIETTPLAPMAPALLPNTANTAEVISSSPSTALSTTPTTTTTTTTLPARSNSVNSSASNASRSTTNSKNHLRVCINRLKAEDERSMRQSIKEFVKKSPELAVKIGLADDKNSSTSSPSPAASTAPTAPTATTPHLGQPPPPASQQAPANSSSIKKEDKQTRPVSGDTFSMMKAADDKRIATKRKCAIKPDEEIPPEQIFSQPKVRRVERNVAPPTPKCSKEEVMRSQTYQQFMKNMEQIIEQLDDTEQPNFESDEIDQNIECITSKMLNVMSNDVAKLKAKMVLDSIPKNKLTLLINYAMRNVYLAKNYSAGPDDEDDIIDDEIMEKILNAIEACLLVCNIYSTARDLKFLQEDNISLIIKFIQFQFRETIFPSYDPVYTVKSMKKMDNRKKTKAQMNHNRSLQLLYSKSVELMKVFVTLFDKCIFVDTIVLPLSTLAIEPFFVDNIDTLQFVCLELVTTIFRKEKYDKMRSSILGDILASIDRLPSSKKNLRPFKLSNNGGNIQMVTALVLQLIQCATILPETIYEPLKNSKRPRSIITIDDNNDNDDEKPEKEKNKDVLVLKKYDVAVSIGGNFLTTFLNKCKTRSNETDFRPLFENFIHDLLATVNKPEWPASELLLSLLGTLLVKYVSDKSIEQSIRLVSLDYLGIVAARLRKDTVESRCKVKIIDSMIKCIKAEQEKEGDLPIVNSKIQLDPEEERIEFLQKILLDFLAVNAQEEDLVWDYARHFYLAQWYRDIIYQRRRIADGEKGYASRKKKTAKKKRRKDESSESSSNSGSSNEDDDSEHGANGSTGVGNNKSRANNTTTDQELNLEIFNVLEDRKKYLLSKIKPYTDMNCTSQHIKTYIDYNNAHLIAQYLASKRPFSQSFDKYLQKIILVVNEPSIAVRTRAMKCLANIVEVDPMVLKRKDMQMGVNQKFLDAAISVREAAVDLVGKFVLSNEELIDQYYDMLSTRILDTGVSVRKRVIKILRDICIDYPDFEKIPEICVKMIRRVNDEEGIQKLVTEVFMKMWFTPCKDNDKHGIQRKINQIIDVVNTAHDTGTTWLEGLLVSIFAPKENMLKPDGSVQEAVKKNTEPAPEIVLACQQLADGLVERLIELEDTDNTRMLGCITTLHLLAKVRPQLLVRHAITIEPYLNIKCHSAIAPKFICSVADILEQVVPLIVNPSESFLASLEEHLMLLVVSLNQAVVTSCVSCLGALVNKITKNYKLIRDCFQKFYRIIENSRDQVAKNNYSIDSIYTPIFRRSLFTIGILMRYFDFKSPKVLGEGVSGFSPQICDEVFECLMFFNQCGNNDIRKQALIALGSFCVMNDDYLTRNELKKFYCDLLQSENIDACIKIICMRNIWIYLTESEIYMHNKEKDWEKQQQTEDLKEMNDVSSGMASRIIQLYLQDILDCFLHRDDSVRLWAVKVVQIVLRQGLVHPVRMVPYLITLSTDAKQESAHRADALLKEIDKTYSGFVNMKVQFGLQLCFKLQEVLQGDRGRNVVIRGFCKKENDVVPTALNDFLYTLLRTTKPQRRALVQTVTKQFDDQKTTLRQMLYIADNLAYFPYVVQDEPLYLIHQIDLMISMAGTNLLATFKECLKPADNAEDVLEDDDDEEDPDVLLKRLPEDIGEIQKCITSAQACMLLLILKQHLKDMYGLTDGKISRYSPSETQKIYEKAVTRKTVPDFNPKSTIEEIKKSIVKKSDVEINAEYKRELVVKYLDFKQLMLKLDPDDADSLDEDRDKSKLNSTAASIDTPSTPALNSTTNAGNQSSLDDIGGESSSGTRTAGAATGSAAISTPHHVNSVNHSTVSTQNQNKEFPATPTTRTTRVAKSSLRKQPTRSKRKKRKIVSSDDDEDDYSDADYA